MPSIKKLFAIFLVFCMQFLTGCAQEQESKPSVIQESKDSATEIAKPDGDNEIVAESYEYWINDMTPYVRQNQDATYSFDKEGFMAHLKTERPNVYTELSGSIPIDENSSYEALAITGLQNSIGIVNIKITDMIAQNGGTPPPSAWSYGYWWGYKVCYSGSNALAALGVLGAGGAISSVIPGIGTLSAAVLGTVLAWAGYYYAVYGQFCINYTWAIVLWVTGS